MTTIITPYEAVVYGFVHNDYPVAYVCDHIPRIEQKLFRKCYLGTDFYNLLIDDLVDHSSVINYDSETIYQIDNLVSYDGKVIKSTCSDNDIHPSDDPENCWITAPKFNNSCYVKLWETNLRYWLAYEMCLASLTYTTYASGANGSTKKTSGQSGREALSPAEFNILKSRSRKDADDNLENMMAWMVEQTKSELAGSCDFSEVDSVSGQCSEDVVCAPFKKTRRRRFYFKN